jgi:hypothetical protein
MIDAVEPSDPEILNLRRCAPSKVGSLRGNDEPRQSKDTRQYGVDGVLDRALRDPVMRSAVGVVRKSACLLYHIAGLGIALVSGPEISRRQRVSKQTSPVAPNSANVILFPNPKRRAAGQDRTGVDDGCLE